VITLKFAATVTYGQPTKKHALGPYLPVRLRRGGVFYDTLGLVDSGADASMFNTEHAKALGLALNPAAVEKGSGVGGDAEMWIHTIELVVAGRTIKADVAFSPTCPEEFGLLGRADFFERFRIGIEQRERRFHYHALP
jgi:hypothetical protein